MSSRDIPSQGGHDKDCAATVLVEKLTPRFDPVVSVEVVFGRSEQLLVDAEPLGAESPVVFRQLPLAIHPVVIPRREL